MVKVGLLSDTHGYLDPKVFQHFKDCDEVWHAGDIGTSALAEALENFKPLKAVYGNIDDKRLQAKFPEDLFFTCEEINVWITHIGGVPPTYNSRIKKMLKTNIPNLFICGHSHILRIKRDPKFNNMLYVNPGAAGNQGFHSMKTLIRFDVNGNAIQNMEVVELGRRGALV
ncbi:MAG TPA: metallophosphoesterase family protein [Chryseolinea sp.]